MGIADPKKLLRKTFRDYGARVHLNAPEGTHWIFPDGAVIIVSHNPSATWAAAQIRKLAGRYERLKRTEHRHLDRRPRKPLMDLERVAASEHAKQRLRLMQGQADVAFQEVLLCLRVPERVLWSEQHQGWLWVRDRLAVAVAEDGDRFVITTVLWSRSELFDLYPREVS